MSVTDPISDLLTRIRNAHRALHADLALPASKLKASIAAILKDEGYIADFASTMPSCPSTSSTRAANRSFRGLKG
jgi:small subunit ribosomal protein S8